MLCAPVFIFTSDSSALLGRPRYGLSIRLSLLAIFNTLFWDYPIFSPRKRTKHEHTRSPPFLHHTKMAADVNTGAQSINTERAVKAKKKKHKKRARAKQPTLIATLSPRGEGTETIFYHPRPLSAMDRKPAQFEYQAIHGSSAIFHSKLIQAKQIWFCQVYLKCRPN